MTESLQYIMTSFGNVGALLIACGVIIFLLNKLRNGSKIDNVTGSLYTQLADQLSHAQAEIRTLKSEMSIVFDQRNTCREDIVRLLTRIEGLEACESTVLLLKDKLDQKDHQISEHMIENKMLMKEILQLKDRIHHLELRLAQDEAKFCQGCEKNV
jgi:chromosome segregation ATPase